MGRQLKRRSKKRIAGRMENGGNRPVFPQHGLLGRSLRHPLVVACVHGAKLPVLVLGARLSFAKNRLAVFYSLCFLRCARCLGLFEGVKKTLPLPYYLPLRVSLP
jgi:hypothetical protein